MALLFLLLTLIAGSESAWAQPDLGAEEDESAPSEEPETQPSSLIEVQPAARDDEIVERLRNILDATGWFSDPDVVVDEGVVFLEGTANDEDSRRWAGDLARNTEGVVAVVNQMDVATPAMLDFRPAWEETRTLGRGVVQALPLFLLALLILGLAWLAARLTTRLTRNVLQRRVTIPLLREVLARTAGILLFLIGLYIILRVSGLTRLAVTVIGGTGLLGLVLGIAFRDITENFLASLFLSLQHPFRSGDLLEIGDATGYVQRLTSRTTILTTLDGNQVQIPNATVFKSTIRNYTSTPNRRVEFSVGIGYDDSIAHAQEVSLRVLADHPAVLGEPEPWVLVDSLGAATVNLKVYFWVDGTRHNWMKVRSSVIRLIKRALQDAGVSLPDEAREVIFPQPVPVQMVGEDGKAPSADRGQERTTSASSKEEPDVVVTAAEGGLETDAADLEEQARHGWSPDGGEDLLSGTPRTTAPAADVAARASSTASS